MDGIALEVTAVELWHPMTMSQLARSVALVAAVLLLGAVAGCRQASEDTTPAAEPGRAIIYPDGAQAEGDISAALAKAAREKKRVLLDFGGNWCGDCEVLEIYFHDPANRNLLESHYVLVPVNIGQYDENLAIAARYGVPVSKGVPALAVLDASGQVVYSQRSAEFSAMRRLDPASVTAFLQEWKG